MRPDEEARLAAALRENLRRRKARARALAEDAAAPAPEAGKATVPEPASGDNKTHAD